MNKQDKNKQDKNKQDKNKQDKNKQDKNKPLSKAEIVRRIIAAHPYYCPSEIRKAAWLSYCVTVSHDTINRVLYKTPVKYANKSGKVYNTTALGKKPMSPIGRKTSDDKDTKTPQRST